MQPSRDQRGAADADALESNGKRAADATPDIAAYFEPLSIEIHPQRDSVRVAPIGELDLDTGPALARELSELTDSGFRSVVLDLRGLEFIDSTGLHLIIYFDKHTRDNGVRFAIIQGSSKRDGCLRSPACSTSFRSKTTPRRIGSAGGQTSRWAR